MRGVRPTTRDIVTRGLDHMCSSHLGSPRYEVRYANLRPGFDSWVLQYTDVGSRHRPLHVIVAHVIDATP